MPFDEEYFASDEFQELLNSYETSEASGDTMFLDADDLVDIADYYNMQGRPANRLRRGVVIRRNIYRDKSAQSRKQIYR